MSSPVADWSLVPGEFSSEGARGWAKGHLLWEVREEAILGGGIAESFGAPYRQSVSGLISVPTSNLIFLKTKSNVSHICWTMILG